ncbi:MAG: hypothetical protein DCC73_03015 [Proteobacteria bacterium]|nr:MAG: hypothetical protein DCC73_03015 [Pseudomonadota bacterium]
MDKSSARKVVEQFCDELHRALTGEAVNPFLLLHQDIEFRHPDIGLMKGASEVSDRVSAAIAKLWKIGPDCGFYPMEFIEEGDQVAVASMSHSEGRSTGDPYNNTYFFLMKVKDGKITYFHESLDSSVVERSGFDKHIEGNVRYPR